MNDSVIDFFNLARVRPDIQTRLWPIAERISFLGALADLGAKSGFHFIRREIEEAFPILSKINDISELERSNTPWPWKGWFPCRARWQDQDPTIEWLFLGNVRFLEPFFDDTIRINRSRPYNSLLGFQTPIDILDQFPLPNPVIQPNGFIFHMSRCGSTLISKTLASLPHCIAISEAPAIDAVLRAPLRNPKIALERQLNWLRKIVHLLGRPKTPDEQFYFIKLDCWHTLSIPLFQKAFPGVPWIFLYRSPEEVMVSHKIQPGVQVVPGLIEPEWYGWNREALNTIPVEEYAARVLGSICQAALKRHRPPQSLLANYSQLPDFIPSVLPDFFSFPCGAEHIEIMRRQFQFHAKNPNEIFASDSEKKKQQAADSIRSQSYRWIYPAYDRLESLRKAELESPSDSDGTAISAPPSSNP
jgi:hypothetical protein